MLKVVQGRNNRALFRGLRNINQTIEIGISRAFLKTGQDLIDSANKSMRQAKHGRWYKIFGQMHRASAKGESPAVLTGALSRSLGVQINKGSAMKFGANTPYARKHELGGRSYLMESINANERNIQRNFEDAIESEFRRGMK